MSMLGDHLERDRIRLGFTVGQIAWRLGITRAEYERIVAGEPIVRFDVWDRIAKLCGWPQTFAGGVAR